MINYRMNKEYNGDWIVYCEVNIHSIGRQENVFYNFGKVEDKIAQIYWDFLSVGLS